MEKELEETINKKKKSLPVLWIVAAVLLIACICGLSVLKLRQDLYEERAYNSGRIMNKIAANIQTVVKTRMDHVNFDADLIADQSFSGDGDAAAYLKKLEDMGSNDNGRDVLLLIDDEGSCLASDGSVFRWTESGMLQTEEHRILVSSINSLGMSEEQMLFLTSLPENVKTADRTFTHICLVMAQSHVGKYLSQASYIDGSALFIIQDNGTYLYKQADDSAFSGVYNLISKLEAWDYLYKTSAEETVRNIRERVSGCSAVSVDGKTYFVIYEFLGINDWTAVYIVPESGASGNSSSFMNAIIRTVLIFALIVTASIIGILLDGHFRSMRQQAKINAQLRRAMEAEKNANDAKTRFLSSMSHDIRTPMNAIIGMTAIAKNHINDTGYVQDCLDKIHLASDHLLTLINDILDISKIESGKMVLTPAVFSLADSINNMFNIVRPQAKAKNQILDIQIQTDIHEFLMADELRLNQIFINILTNAVKYTPEEGKITASVKVEPDPDKAENVRLTYIVEDTGIGMSGDYMENMYGSFSRGTDSRINKIQGTGLGLAICKQLVDMMDGTIECESELGKGTKFTVTICLPVAEHPAGSYKLPGMKMLLVDDDEMFLEASSELLHEMDIELEIAENGEEAIAKTSERCSQNNEYSVILMDWKMAGLDGIETLKRIHATIDAEVPIILISAYDSTDIEQIALDMGAAGFIRKPFFKASLHEQLSRYLALPDVTVEDGVDPDLEGMHILMAEDNDMNWEIASELLSISGIHTERAENGQLCVERMEAAADGEFDAILMDIQMPVMDGRQATRKIRKSDRDYLKNIPIFALTANAFAEDISECLEAGMNGHIAKPIDLNRLLSELKKVKLYERKGDS